MKKVVIGIVVVVAAVLVLGFVPLVDVPYQATETYYEDEPYEVTETYYVDEPYQVTENYTEDVEKELQIVEHRLERDLLLFVRGKIRNTTNQTLYWADVIFEVQYEIADFLGRTFSRLTSLDPIPPTLRPGEVRDFETLVEEGTIRYKVIPPKVIQTVERQRIVTKYRQVEQQRTITKYKQVEKERLVTQYRKVSVFDYLRSRF